MEDECNRGAIWVFEHPAVTAWSLSAIFHTALFFLAAAMVRPIFDPHGNEPEPPVEIFWPSGAGVLTSAGFVPLATESIVAGSALNERWSDDMSLLIPSLDPDAAFTSINSSLSHTLLESAGDNIGSINFELGMTNGGVRSSVKDELGKANGGANAGTGRHAAAKGGTRVPSRADVDGFVKREQASLAARRPRGEPGQVRLFGGSPASGRSFIFLIDRSQSMSGTGLASLDAAEHELLVGIRDLAAYHQFQVVAYNDACAYFQRRGMISASDENKSAVSGFLDGLTPSGATDHERALLSALQYTPDVVYLLTDGGEPGLTEGQIRTISHAARGHSEIHCVEFGLGPRRRDTSFLERLAAQNRGGYIYVDISRYK